MIPDTLPDPREARLPVWAQGLIGRLRREVEDERRRADEARGSGGPEDTDTVIDPYDDVPIRLPKGERVRFLVGRDHYEWIDCQVLHHATLGRVVQVMAGTSLVVHPSVTNVVYLGVRQ